MLMRQAKLQSGNTYTMCWIDANIKPKSKIRFKNETRFWDVKEVYSYILEKTEINCDWKVGGI